MISPFDGKLRRQLHEYTDKLQKQIPYLAPEVIYQVRRTNNEFTIRFRECY